MDRSADTSTAPPHAGADITAADCQVLIDALTAHVALCDGDGRILAVNRAWRQFADDNDGREPDYGIGTNYLHLAECSAERPAPAEDADLHAATASAVAQGMRRVLQGEVDRFQTEYRCDAPDRPRWYLLTITSYPGGGHAQMVVSHEDITGIRLAEHAALRHQEQLATAYSGAVEALALMIEQRDPYTAGHQREVARWSEAIAATLGLDMEQRRGLLLGARIHDIGKISIPVELLTRPGRLNPLEMAMIRGHAAAGYEVLCSMSFPWPVADMVHQHHERFDGSGYPLGLRGEDICVEARIIAVADVFDAMTSHRPYRPSRGPEEAIAELRRGRGTSYDPAVVDAMLEVLGDLTADAAA